MISCVHFTLVIQMHKIHVDYAQKLQHTGVHSLVLIHKHVLYPLEQSTQQLALKDFTKDATPIM